MDNILSDVRVFQDSMRTVMDINSCWGFSLPTNSTILKEVMEYLYNDLSEWGVDWHKCEYILIDYRVVEREYIKINIIPAIKRNDIFYSIVNNKQFKVDKIFDGVREQYG